MHPVAEEGFGRTVGAYRRSRPSYPPEAAEWLANALGIGPGSTVVDVGAGTGLYTAQLTARGATVIAVEPLEAMRDALAEELPDVLVLAGTAESLPLDSGSADAIVAAQSFHWFDGPTTLPEFHRVLRPGGRLGVIWNELDTGVGWVRQLNDIIAVPRTGTPHPSEARLDDLGELFGRPEHAEFRHAHLHDRASLLQRVASMSFVAVLPDHEREAVFAQVAALIDSHPQTAGRDSFDLPYLTDAWWAQRSGR
jgi:SAM-dependent methyltransferase